jgi:hypothetical protein
MAGSPSFFITFLHRIACKVVVVFCLFVNF